MRSVYIIPSESAAKCEAKTSSDLYSLLGIISSSSGSSSCYFISFSFSKIFLLGIFEHAFFTYRSRCPFSVAIF